MDDVCDCGRVIVQPEIGRRRVKCFVCSPPDKRNGTRHRGEVVTLPIRDPDSGLVAASRKALDAAGALDTWQGVAAIRLAELCDAGKFGASGPANAIRAHRMAMEFALQAASEGAEVLDIIDRIFLDG
jgi:hypothetical protein